MHQTGPNARCFNRQFFISTLAVILTVYVILFAAGCAGTQPAEKTAIPAGADAADMPDESQLQLPPVRFSDLTPADPQPAADALRPGLFVLYYFNYFERHLDPLADIAASANRGRAGKPIPYLNHRFGKGKVFDSGTNRGVAMRMRGMLQFPAPGEYTFRAISNDGLRIRIDDNLIIDDPDQHSDQYAVQAIVDIPRQGWYPFSVEYFQRKGTATLVLFWRTPSAKDFVPVPAARFAHLP